MLDGLRKAVWVANESECVAPIAAARACGLAGYDSEFDGLDINTQSCVGRARVHVFSLATPSGPLDPLGFNEPESWVFPARLMNYGPLKALLEDASVRMAVHNQFVDAHAAYNAGVSLGGCINTLSMARWIYPARAALVSGNYDLDSLCRWRMGRGKTEDFNEFLGYWDTEPAEHTVHINRCSCGELRCRKKTGIHWGKNKEAVTEAYQKKVRKILPLEKLNESHALWARYLAYAAADAELALSLYQLMLRDGRAERPYPWGAF